LILWIQNLEHYKAWYCNAQKYVFSFAEHAYQLL